MGVKKSNKRIRVTRCSVTSQNNVKNEEHKHQVKIYNFIITYSILCIFFFARKNQKLKKIEFMILGSAEFISANLFDLFN